MVVGDSEVVSDSLHVRGSIRVVQPPLAPWLSERSLEPPNASS